MATWKDYELRLKELCNVHINWLEKEMSLLRVGRANPNFLNNVKVESYGKLVELKSISNIQVPEPRQLLIKPFDKVMLSEIVSAINKANLNLNPVVNGDTIRLTFPQPSTETRQVMVKKLKELGEQTKVQCRNSRQTIQKNFKLDKDLSDDIKRKYEENLNKSIKEINNNIEQMLITKEKEIMKV